MKVCTRCRNGTLVFDPVAAADCALPEEASDADFFCCPEDANRSGIRNAREERFREHGLKDAGGRRRRTQTFGLSIGLTASCGCVFCCNWLKERLQMAANGLRLQTQIRELGGEQI